MTKLKINRTYFGLAVNVVISIILYLTYLDIYNSITTKELTAFGSPIQFWGSMVFVAYVFSVVILILQVIIFALKKLAVLLGLTD